MLPPKMPLSEYCACPDGRHVRRFLPIPETDLEKQLIELYISNYQWADETDLADTIGRFMEAGPTVENFTWARYTEHRMVDRFYEERHGRAT